MLIAPTAPCADDIVAELHIIIYREQIGHTLDIMGRSHVGKWPAFLLELLYQAAEISYTPLVRGILQTIGQNSHNDRGHTQQFYGYPYITPHFACLDCRYAFVLDEKGIREV